MKLRQCRRSGFGWITSVCIVGIVLLLNTLGVFKATDHALHDFLRRLGSQSSLEKHVLLVYTSDDNRIASKQLEPLLERILRYEPKRIGIVPDGILRDGSSIARFGSADNLVIGQRLDQILQPENQNEASPTRDFKTGYTDLHFTDQALYRDATPRVNRMGQQWFSFEAELARTSLPSDSSIPDGQFGIQFDSGSDSLPNLSADEILSGNVISELIENKIVLIGAAQDSSYGLVTPSQVRDTRMNRLEVRGHIVETLLQQNAIFPVGLLAGAILIALIVLALSPIPRQFRGRWFVVVWMLSLGVGLMLCTASLFWFSRYLPVSAILFAITLSFGAILYQRFQILNSITEYWRLMLEVNSTQSKVLEQDQLWNSISDSVYQMCYPTRLVIMELEPGATHMSIVKTTHCEESEINEKRRDIQRSPFKEILEQGRPTQAHSRSFYHPAGNRDEIEFLIPLSDQGRTLGLMVLGMDANDLQRWQDFGNFLEQFSDEVSQLIVDHRSHHQRSQSSQTKLHKFQTLPEQRKYNAIEMQKRSSLNQVAQIEQAFESSENALAICDIFGHIKKRNSRLVRFLQDAQITISSTSCVEMMASISGLDIEDCRRAFRQAIIEGRTQCWNLAPTKRRPTSCQLHVKPIQLVTDHGKSEIEARGVLLEIVDGAAFDQNNQWLDQLTDSNIQSMEHRLAGLRRRADALQNGKDKTNFENAANSIQDTVEDLVRTLEDCQSIIRGRNSKQADETLAFDTKLVWQSVLEEIQPRLEQRNIQISSHLSDEPGMGIANPFLLRKVFHSIMEIMIENAFEQSEIFVGMEPTGREVHFRFQNQGNATPMDGFRKSMGSDPRQSIQDNEDNKNNDSSLDPKLLLNDNQLDRFNEVKLWLEAWDGTLLIRKGQDFGMSIELALMSEQNSAQSLGSKISHSNKRLT